MGDKSQKTETNIHPALQGVGRSMIKETSNWYANAGALPSQYVGIDPSRQMGMQRAEQMAQQGTAVPQAGLGNWLATQQGAFLGPESNPWLQQNVQRAIQAGMPGITSGFAAQGRFGSGAMANAYQDLAQRTAANLYGQNYQMERDRMMQSLGQLPQMYQAQFADARELERVGMMREADVGQQQAEQMRQYMWPIQKIGMAQQAYASNPLAAYRKTESWQPFDWGGAAVSMVGGMLQPSVPGMGGK